MQTSLRLVVLTMAAVGFGHAAESALSFVDLRAGGGVTVSNGETVNLTLMAGDIGNKDQHIISLDADMGVVIGLRGQMANVTAKRADGLGDLDLKLGGGTLMGGLGFYLGKNSHAELLFGYARGVGTQTGSGPWDERDSSYTQFLGELGWYYTWNSHLLVGITAGYSQIKVTWDNAGTDVDAKAKGIDAGIALGYRF
jgi:hypothetical protein